MGLQVPPLAISSQPRPRLACNQQEAAVSSSGNPPRCDVSNDAEYRFLIFYCCSSCHKQNNVIIFRVRDQHVQEDKGSSTENKMPKTNIPHEHQLAPDPSNQDSGGQENCDLLSGWLNALLLPVTTNDSVFMVNVPSYTLSYSGAWKQVEKCTRGLRFERQPSASPKG